MRIHTVKYGNLKVARMGKKQVFAATLLLVWVVFIIGIIVGNYFSNPALDEINKIVRSSELSTESYLIEQNMFKDFEKNCELSKIRLSSLSNELWRLGKLLASPTAKNDLGDYQYDFLKRKYHLMQIKIFVLYYQFKTDCSVDDSVILFYYGRDDNYSFEQGQILDRLVQDFGIHVFAIERDYAPELKFLEQYYEINMSPSLVIDYKLKKEGLTSYEDLRSIILDES